MPKKPRLRDQPKQSGKCQCGRSWSDAVRHQYHSGTHRYVFYRCECGLEWTVEEQAADQSAPVSAEEVVDVHEILKKDLPIQELIEPE